MKLSKILFLVGITFIVGFQFSPMGLEAQGSSSSDPCYNIKGGKPGIVMGIPACFCGPGLECLCVTEVPCKEVEE